MLAAPATVAATALSYAPHQLGALPLSSPWAPLPPPVLPYSSLVWLMLLLANSGCGSVSRCAGRTRAPCGGTYLNRVHPKPIAPGVRLASGRAEGQACGPYDTCM